MSEMYNEDAIFESIRQDLEDPYVVEFFANIKDKQEMINYEFELGNFSEDQRSKLVDDLDRTWIYFGQDIYLNGSIIPLEGDEGTRLIVEDVPAKSKGFEIYKAVMADEESDDDTLRIGMVFTLENSDGTLVNALASIDDISLEYPFPSQEKMEQKLDNELVEYREELDEIVFQDGSIEDIIKGLADFKYEYDGDRGPDHDALKALERYINLALDLDKQLPYYIQIDNEIYADKDGHFYKKEVSDLFDVAGAEKLVMLGSNETNDDGTCAMTCFLKMRHYSQLSNEPSTTFYVDVANVKSFIPMRDDVDTEFFD